MFLLCLSVHIGRGGGTCPARSLVASPVAEGGGGRGGAIIPGPGWVGGYPSPRSRGVGYPSPRSRGVGRSQTHEANP